MDVFKWPMSLMFTRSACSEWKSPVALWLCHSRHFRSPYPQVQVGEVHRMRLSEASGAHQVPAQWNVSNPDARQ
jgi:hypothetical protein